MTGIGGKIPYGAGLTRKWKNSNEKKLLKKRNPRPGYPLDIVFKTKEEIEEYLSQEKITCLLCGRNFKSLGNHLLIHNYSVEDYKRKYGLPFRKGLMCPANREKNSNQLKQRLKEGKISREHITPEFLRTNAKKSAELHYDRRQPFRHENDLKLLKKAVKVSSQKRKSKTHCKYGHLYNEKRICQVCNTENSRKRLGTMDRSISKTIKVTVKCSICNEDTLTCRLNKGRKIIFCEKCKLQKYRESQKKYNETYKERRKEMAKIAYEKRKGKQA